MLSSKEGGKSICKGYYFSQSLKGVGEYQSDIVVWRTIQSGISKYPTWLSTLLTEVGALGYCKFVSVALTII